MSHTIQVIVRGITPAQSEELIALLSEQGFEAFEEQEDSLSAYIPEFKYGDQETRAVIDSYTQDWEILSLAPRNWNAEWEQQYQPVVVENRIGIRATFHPPLEGVQHEIVITPKMSFGTGHHATTWQMLNAMYDMSLAGKRVFDYGCGTGVLAIFAGKLGATEMIAMDIDDWCIENTEENALANGCEEVVVVQGEAPPQGRIFDVILANINRHILLENMKAMSDVLEKNGYLLISGFYAYENDILILSAGMHGLKPVRQSEKDEWSCILLQKTNG